MADPLSAGIGAGISAIGSFASAAIGGHQARKNMKLQAALNYKYAKKSALNSPTWTRQGLTDAGYNPMLAVQNATSGTNSSWSGLGSQDSPDFAGAISSGIANAQSFKRLENETETAESTVAMNNATSRKANADAANLEAENPYIPDKMRSEIGKTQAEIGNINQDTELKSATIDNLKARLELDRYLGEMGIDVQRQANSIADYNARTSRKSYELENDKYQGSQDKWMTDWAEKHPNLYGLYRHTDNVAKLAGSVFGAGNQFSNHTTIEKVDFDRNGAYKGHSRTSKHKSHK